MSATADFFHGRFDQMIDLRHPLAVQGSRMPWQEIEAALALQFARRVREDQRVELAREQGIASKQPTRRTGRICGTRSGATRTPASSSGCVA
jgi:hypothetical protein